MQSTELASEDCLPKYIFCLQIGRLASPLAARSGCWGGSSFRVLDKLAKQTAVRLAGRLAGCHAALRRYPCIYCGPSPEYDAFIIEDDNEDEAYCIMDNFKAAYANKCASSVGSNALEGTSVYEVACWRYRHCPRMRALLSRLWSWACGHRCAIAQAVAPVNVAVESNLACDEPVGCQD